MAKETLVAVGTIMTSKGKIGPGEIVPSGVPAKDLKQLKELGLVEHPQAADADDAEAVDQADDAAQKVLSDLQSQVETLTGKAATLTTDLEAERAKSADLEKELATLQAAIESKAEEGTDQTGLPLDGKDVGAAE